jgi:CelD/BcsL family acetyltransferase involved in cellulose biosynthesis
VTDLAVAGYPARETIHKARHAVEKQRRVDVDVVIGEEAFNAIDEWRAFAAVQTGTTPFQAPEFLSPWKRHFGGRGQCVTITVRDANGPLLFWPLFIERRPFLTIATGAGGPIGQYDEVLLRPGTESGAAVQAALDTVAESIRPDLIFLERVRGDGALAAALSGLRPLCCAEAAPYADLSRGTAALLASLKSRVVRQQNKRMRRFKDLGGVFELARDSDEAERWLLEAMEMKREWLKGTGRISRAFVKPETARCLAELVRLPDGQHMLRAVVSRVTLDGRTAAIEMGFCHRQSYHLYLGAFAPEFAKLGPGNVLTQYVMGWCTENGIERYDMMAPRTRNKSEWQSGEVPVMDFALPLTIRGKLYVATVYEQLSPALRTLFYALPARLRSLIANAALRM